MTRCFDCKFAYRPGYHGLECRRYPPQHTGLIENVRPQFPRVSDTDWCGEFQPLVAQVK